jgi:C4-dicarboxylate transporter DctM subunit
MEWYFSALIILGLLLGLLALRVHVGFALGLTGVIGIFFFSKVSALSVIGTISWEVSTNFVLICAPLFLLMGEIIFRMKVAESFFDFLHKLFGNVPGGLAVATVVASGFMGAITGIALAVVAIIGPLAYPEMKKRSYSSGLSTGVIASSSGLGILIPPSLPFILFGLITGESIGRLFMAGIVPGIMIIALYSAYCILASKLGLEQAPAMGRVSMKEKAKGVRGVWPILLLIVVVLGGIYLGVMTPTEAAAIGCVGAMAIAATFKTLTRETIKTALMESARANAAIFMVVIGAKFFGYLVSTIGIPQELAAWVISVEVSPPVVMLSIQVLFVILGMLMDVTPIVLITTPILYPIVVTMGWNPIWYATLLIVNMMAAVVTPPVGLCLFLTGDITGVPLTTIIRGSLPFLAIIGLSLVILYVFPEITLWLPNHMFGK